MAYRIGISHGLAYAILDCIPDDLQLTLVCAAIGRFSCFFFVLLVPNVMHVATFLLELRESLCRVLCAREYGWVLGYLSLLPYWELVPWALLAPLPAEPWLLVPTLN